MWTKRGMSRTAGVSGRFVVLLLRDELTVRRGGVTMPMPISTSVIHREIYQVLRKHAFSMRECSIGITSRPDLRLGPDQHDADLSYVWETYTNKEARQIESHWLDKGMDGGEGGGHDDSVYVYMFFRDRLTDRGPA